MTTMLNGRIYEITDKKEVGENLKKLAIASGHDGFVYTGISKKTGRQRSDLQGLFFRFEKSGKFHPAY